MDFNNNGLKTQHFVFKPLNVTYIHGSADWQKSTKISAQQ